MSSSRSTTGPAQAVSRALLHAKKDDYDKENTIIGFAFDIDGVHVKGATPIPGAAESILALQQNNLPFTFLTNGGGSTEKEHLALVGRRLGVSLDEEQFVQSHTPFRDLLPEFADKTILVLGGTKNQIRDVAHEYGFRKVLTSSDIVKAEGNHVHPFLEMTKEHHEQHGIFNFLFLRALSTSLKISSKPASQAHANGTDRSRALST